MLHRKHLILVLINTLAHGADIAWQNSCCGTLRSLPRNWTDNLCWSPPSIPGVNDRALFQISGLCIVRLNAADSVSIGELYVSNSKNYEMQLIGPAGGSNSNFTVGIFAIKSFSVLTIIELNVVFKGSSSVGGKLNLTDCRATGPGSATISGSPAELVLFRSSPHTLEFHVPDVTIVFGGQLKIISEHLLSSSRIQNFGKMEVDVARITQLQGAVCLCDAIHETDP
jgi:hypothetical protein